MSDIIGLYKCRKCGVEKSYTNEYFNYRNKKQNILEYRCKVCVKEYQEKNKDYVRKLSKEYYKNNCEIIKNRVNNYRINNLEDINIKKKVYREKNKDKINKDIKRIWKENKERYDIARMKYNKSDVGRYVRNVASQKYASKRKENEYNYTHIEWKICVEYFNNKDAYTGLVMKTRTQDHIIPQSKNGAYRADNIIPCDSFVNCSKLNKDMEEWYRKQYYFSEERLNKIKYWISNCNEIIKEYIEIDELKRLRKENKKEK